MTAEDRLMSVAEVAAYTTLSRSAFANWATAKDAAEDHGPASFKLGRRRVYRRSVVVAWLAEQEAAGRRDVAS